LTEEPTTVVDERYENLRRKLARTLAAICPPWLRDRSDDIVQMAMIRIMEIERRSEGNPEFKASYLWKVAYSVMVDEIRKVRRLQEVPLEMNVHDLPGREGPADPERNRVRREIGVGIQDCLMQLADSRRAAVALHLQGHSVPDAARVLGWSPKRTENLVYRGLVDLRDCLARKGLNP